MPQNREKWVLVYKCFGLPSKSSPNKKIFISNPILAIKMEPEEKGYALLSKLKKHMENRTGRYSLIGGSIVAGLCLIYAFHIGVKYGKKAQKYDMLLKEFNELCEKTEVSNTTNELESKLMVLTSILGLRFVGGQLTEQEYELEHKKIGEITSQIVIYAEEGFTRDEIGRIQKRIAELYKEYGINTDAIADGYKLPGAKPEDKQKQPIYLPDNDGFCKSQALEEKVA